MLPPLVQHFTRYYWPWWTPWQWVGVFVVGLVIAAIPKALIAFLSKTTRKRAFGLLRPIHVIFAISALVPLVLRLPPFDGFAVFFLTLAVGSLVYAVWPDDPPKRMRIGRLVSAFSFLLVGATTWINIDHQDIYLSTDGIAVLERMYSFPPERTAAISNRSDIKILYDGHVYTVEAPKGAKESVLLSSHDVYVDDQGHRLRAPQVAAAIARWANVPIEKENETVSLVKSR